MEIYTAGLSTVYSPLVDGENSCGPQGICPVNSSNVILQHTVGQTRVSIGGVEVVKGGVLFSTPAPR